MTNTRTMVLCGLALLAAAGCNDESGGPLYGNPDTDAKLPDVTIPKDELDQWEVYSFAELTEPFDTEDECIAFQDKEYGDTSALTKCRCNNCLDRMQECDVMQGCVEIRDCAVQSGCNSELTCYLLPGAPCTDVIDDWGNASVATATSIELMDCSKAKGCQ